MRLIIGLFALGMILRAAVTTGGISGVVLDASGLPVAGARIVLAGPQGLVLRSASTDESGYYRFLDVPPAEYSLECSAAKFATAKATGRVSVDTNTKLDFRLNVSGMTQKVVVKDVPLPVQTESAELGALLSREQVDGLPLNERDFLQLALLTPGVAPPVQGSSLSTRGDFAMHANGAREEFNDYLLDGVDNNDQDVNRYVLEPSVDAIEEFKIATNSYSAEYGRNAGGQINVITRSGGDQWHGFAYEYLRNRDLDARNFFDGSVKPEYARSQFGGGGGGPLVRGRTFVFADFDGLRERQSVTELASVPTDLERTGNLSQLGVTVVDPFTQIPFPNSTIPTGQISPLVQKILSLYPRANLPGLAGNLLAQPVGSDTRSQVNLRLDQKLTTSDQLSLRYSFGDKSLFEPYSPDNVTGVPGYGDILGDHGHNAMARWIRTISPTVTQALLLGFNRGTRNLLPQNSRQNVNSLWGVNYLPTDALDYGYPSINVTGLSPVGDATTMPIARAENTYQATDTVSMVRGAHGLTFGAEARRVQLNARLDVLSRGSMSFFGGMTGAGIGDLLLGLPSLAIQSQANNPQTLRSSALDGFVQDDWKLRPGLTVNLGLRYEFNTPSTDPTGRMSIFDRTTGNLVPVGTNGISASGIRTDWNNFAPRVGFAWMLSQKTVMRGGYGIYYDSGMFEVNSALYFNPPYFNLFVYVPSANGLLTVSNPFPSQAGFTPAPSLNTLSPDLVTPYMQSWNFALQRDLGRGGSLTAAYAGSKGTHLIRGRDLNQPPPGPGDVQSRAPYPDFSNIMLVESAANSSYNSLQLSYNRPLASRLSVLAVYTLSKSIDSASAFLATSADQNFPQNSRNTQADRAVSSFDIHQRAAVSWVYKLPGQRSWTRNFETSAILTAQSGQAFSALLQQDNSNTGNTGGSFGSDRPNLLFSPVLAHPSPSEWFNTAAFAIPAPFTFGNAGRNILRGPGLFTVDVSVSRRFRLAERASLTAVAQAFNLLNRANFNLPQAYADDPANFGRIYSAKDSRQVQFALRMDF